MKKSLTFLTLLFFHHCIWSQSIANYASVRSTGITYNSISSPGFSFNNWRNTTNFTQDDNRSDFKDIGFDFWYNGIRYTQFCVSTNGFIDFSNSTDDGGPVADDFGYNNAAFTAANAAQATRPAIAPFYDDLTAQGGTEALGNSIKYFLSGAAPNRTLTIEWINMAVYLNTSPSLNFQVHLLETSGIIMIHYGTMNTGTQLFSYSMGLNAPVVSNPPTAAQLKMLQTVNTNNLNNTVQNNLSQMPAANSRYVFTPPVPTAPAGSLSFNAITQSGMTLNWTNWATNEVGYVIYNSTDGINYSFVTQTAANATSAAITGLLPSTLYYWRVYAVTEGCLSTPLNGSQSTISAGNKISVTSGNWGTANTWSPTGVPVLGDNVTIANNHVVTINTAALCNSLTVGQGGAATLQFGTNQSRSLTINSNLLINSGASFSVANSNAIHSINIKGNITNNGILDFSAGANFLCNATFSKNSAQTISGTGSRTRFNLITLDMGNTVNNVLEITCNTFTAPVNFLTLNNGTFKFSGGTGISLTPFSSLYTIQQTAGLWLNSPNSNMTVIGGLNVSGAVTVSGGTLNVGNAANQDFLSSGGSLNISGGVVNIAGKYYATGINNLCYLSVSGGTLTLPTVGSTNTTIAPFQIIGAGSQFNMTGGRIIIPREGGTGAQDLGYVNTINPSPITDGTLQIGNSSSPAAQTICINSSAPIGNLELSSTNATAKLLTNNLNIAKNIAINTGTLASNNLNITLGGNWTNSGGIFTPGTSIVTFSSALAQSLSRTGGETFNHLLFTGSGIKTFSSAVTTNGNFSVSPGATTDISATNYSLNVKGNFLNNGSFVARTGLVAFTGTVAQNIGGSSVTNFYDMSLSNNSGASLSNTENLLGTLTLTAGTLNTNNNLTMVSTATATARIASILGTGNIIGNVTVQRFIPGGTTGWAFLGTPISSALTLNDWDDDIAISCPTCPDGSAGGFLSIYHYNETVSGAFDNYLSYIPLNTINDPIVPGRGYWVYMGTAQYTTANITMDVTGTVRKFNYTIPLSYSNYGSPFDDGWNLIHNPYPSPISWTALKGATSNIDNAIYIWNADLNGGTGGHASFVNGVSSPAVGAGGIGNTIPMWQGFYVHSTGATSLNGTESVKVAGNPTFLKENSSTSSLPLLRLSLKGLTYDDETVLYLQQGASEDFDENFDAYKLSGQDPNAPFIALEKDGKQFQINGVAPISGNFSMPLKTITGYSGTYTISLSESTDFPQGACITLYDIFTGISTNLKTSSYTYSLSSSTTAARFNLNITLNPLNTFENILQPNCSSPANGKIIVSGTNSGPWNYYWTTNGVAVRTSLNKFSADTLQNLSYGIYKLEINTVGQCDNKTSEFQINAAVIPVSSFNSPDTLDITINSSVSFTNNSQYANAYSWDFGDGSAPSPAFEPVHTYSNTGVYQVKLKSWSASGCADSSYHTIVILDPVGINDNTPDESSLIVKTLQNNEFVILKKLANTQTVSFILYDLSGRKLEDFGSRKTNNVDLKINLAKYSPGVYLLTMLSDSQKTTLKLPVK